MYSFHLALALSLIIFNIWSRWNNNGWLKTITICRSSAWNCRLLHTSFEQLLILIYIAYLSEVSVIARTITHRSFHYWILISRCISFTFAGALLLAFAPFITKASLYEKQPDTDSSYINVRMFLIYSSNKYKNESKSALKRNYAPFERPFIDHGNYL